MKLDETFRKFLNTHYDTGKSVLLALSGGVDSRVLFELLLLHKVSFSVAHVDHSWRSESATEAKVLEALAHQHRIPFYLKTLDPLEWKEGNSEEACRRLRLSFFRELCLKHHFQAVLTGHHADDLAETVLKRAFESGSLTTLYGMHPVTDMKGLKIWRPLLSIRKSEILSWALSHNTDFYEDITNQDSKYLRARFRKSTLPFLNETFGKEIVSSLCQLGFESALLQDYLTQKTAPLVSPNPNTPLGWFLTRSSVEQLHSLEQRFLLQTMTKNIYQAISRAQITQLMEAIASHKNNRSFPVGEWNWFVERAGLFLLPKTATKTCNSGNWVIESEPISILSDQKLVSNWENLLRGKGEVILPEGEYSISFEAEQWKFPGRSGIGKWWSAQHVPHCLWHWPPLILHCDRVIHEFLSGRSIFELTKYKSWVKITIKPPDYQIGHCPG